MIYFIKCNSFIKIGYCQNLKKRIGDLQSSNPYKLKLIFLFKGDRKLENIILKHFTPWKVKGEWHKIKPEKLETLLKKRLFKNGINKC